MKAAAKKRFDSVSLRDEWGAADESGFRLHDSCDPSRPGFPFSVCRIAGKQVAVFVDREVPAAVRAELASRRPESLHAVVFARVISEPRAEVAVIEAHASSTDDAELEACAFAAACGAFSFGLFAVTPSRYSIRFEGCSVVAVTMDFDADSGSWFGEAAISQ
jgi:hypothetical protein